MSKILIIFGSSSGNTQLVVEAVAEILEKNNIQTQIQRGELTKLEDLNSYKNIILASPTYGHGILQQHMIPITQKIRESDFSDKNFAIIGLGDNKYDKNYTLESAVILEKAVNAAKGKHLHIPLLILKSPVSQLQKIEKWTKELVKKIK